MRRYATCGALRTISPCASGWARGFRDAADAGRSPFVLVEPHLVDQEIEKLRRGQGRDGPVIIGRIQRRIRRGRADFFDGGLGEIGPEPNGSPYL
jgi:hypothetical protein